MRIRKIVTGGLLALGICFMPSICHAEEEKTTVTIDQYIKEVYGKDATLDAIQLNKTESIDEAHVKDFITGEINGRVLSDKEVEVIRDGKKVKMKISDLKDKDITVHHVSDGVYEEPELHRTSQKASRSVVIAEYNRGNITKTDKETGKAVVGSKFGLYINADNGKWQRVADLQTGEAGTTGKVEKTVSTKEYNIKEWVSNYDKLSPANKKKYAKLAKSEPEDKADKKTEEELAKELNKLAEEEKAKPVKWMVIEDENKGGYLRSDKTWKGKIENNLIKIPAIKLTMTKITGEVEIKKDIQLSGVLNLSLTMMDGITNEVIKSGAYDAEISDDSHPGKFLRIGALKANKGVWTGKYSLKETGRTTCTSGKVTYLKDYGSLPTYAKKLYSKDAKSQKEAKETAKKRLASNIAKAKKDYNNKERSIRLVEKEVPAGYKKLESTTIMVKNGKGASTIKREGAGKIDILVLDETGNPVSGAKIVVETAKGKHKIVEYESGNETKTVDKIVAGASYIIRQAEPPKGYVKLKDSTKTITSNATGDTKQTKLVEYKAEYQHEIKGYTIGVYDAKNRKVDEWVTDGNVHMIDNLVQGAVYEIREDKVPAGYAKNEPVKLTVKNQNIKIDQTSYKTTITATRGLKESEYTVIDAKSKVIVDKWTTGKRNIEGLERGHEYIVRQTKNPKGYVLADNLTFIAGEEDQNLKISNSRVKLEVRDTAGQYIEGIKVDIVDSDKKVIEEYITSKQAYYPSNLQSNREYAIIQKDTGTGYTLDKNWVLKTGDDGQDYHHLFTSKVQKIDHIDEDSEAIEGSQIEIVDSEGKTVDKWTSGEHIIDLDVVSQSNLQNEGRVILKGKELRRSVPLNIREQSLGYLEMCLQESLPYLYNNKGDYTPKTYLEMAFEKLPMKTEEKDRKITGYLHKIDKIKGTSDHKEVEKTRSELSADMNNLMDSLNHEFKDVDNVIIRKTNAENQYDMTTTMKDGTKKYTEIDKNGNERAHRASNIKNGEQYTVKVTKPAGLYNGTVDLHLQADIKDNTTMKIIAEKKIKTEKEKKMVLTPRMIVWIALTITGIGVIWIFRKLAKKSKQGI